MHTSLESAARRERQRLLTALTRAFGAARLDLVESSLQEAFVKAMQEWPARGEPENPAGWLLTVAKNHAHDQIRREATFARREDDVAAFMATANADVESDADRVLLKGEIADDNLRMMFVACHPANALPSQIALALRTLCGFEVEEIARALLSDSQAIEKRLVRARQRLREERVGFELPADEELAARLDAVLHVLYLLFNEGYSASRGVEQIRGELCAEALRLVQLLLDDTRTALPKVHALCALFLLQSSRFDARTSESGSLLTLAEQDRSQWDRPRIQAGLMHLAQSARGEAPSPYHLEAAIAACHATATRYEETDWNRVVELYDVLHTLAPSPIVALNQAIAIGRARGAERGVARLRELAADPSLADNISLHAAIAEFSLELGHIAEACAAFEHALTCAGTEPEREYLRRKLAATAGLTLNV
jgi:RNA polymerase sigma-70 factor (ECF subfamily)